MSIEVCCPSSWPSLPHLARPSQPLQVAARAPRPAAHRFVRPELPALPEGPGTWRAERLSLIHI
eukprot:8986940-Alexandrium_andersonii.AAC.1